jgi:hypothetical protein
MRRYVLDRLAELRSRFAEDQSDRCGQSGGGEVFRSEWIPAFAGSRYCQWQKRRTSGCNDKIVAPAGKKRGAFRR